MLKLEVDLSKTLGEFEQQFENKRRYLRGVVTKAMRLSAADMKAEWRAQLQAGGVTLRLQNTVRDRTYPDRDVSMGPTGRVWTNAPEIMMSMAAGGVIRPKNGGRYLAIPTDECPKTRKGAARGGSRKMTPLEVEIAFNQDLIFRKTERGHLGAFVRVVKSRNQRRRVNHWRIATQRRLDAGRDMELVMMFTLVRSVRARKILNVERIAQVGQQAFPRHLQDNWR